LGDSVEDVDDRDEASTATSVAGLGVALLPARFVFVLIFGARLPGRGDAVAQSGAAP
jgi:hypothetical protein